MNELILSGPVSEQEVRDLDQILNDVKVVEITSSETFQLSFYNLDVINFTKDLLLPIILSDVIKKIKQTITFFKVRGKTIKHVRIENQIHVNKKRLLLTISSDPINLDTAISMTNDKLSLIINDASNIDQVHIKLEEGTDDIKDKHYLIQTIISRDLLINLKYI